MAIKLSDFLVSMVLISSIIVVFMLILADGANTYSTSYDNTTFAEFNTKTAQLYNLTDTIKNDTTKASSQNTIPDIVGSLFSQGWTAIKTIFTSVDLFTSMTAAGINELPLGKSQNVLTSMLLTIVLIVIVIGIFAAILLKWQT